jgi:hypothetical protein
MAGRSRTTKKLAQRIDLNYFNRLYPIPRWRRILTVAVLATAALWLGWDALAGKQRVYSAGPLAHSHALLTGNCRACHATPTWFGRKITDAACIACHDGPAHHAEQTFTPACAACHVEHQNSFRLARVRSEACAECHADLKTKIGRTTFAAKIATFEDHPEFAALLQGAPSSIRMNHQVHLAENLRGPRGAVHLTCSDCHAREQGQMLRVDYANRCASCHPLMFDPRIPEPAPHGQPQIVVDFALNKLTQYIAAHPEELRASDGSRPPAGNAAEWLARRVAGAEQLLWRKTCEQCHTLTFAPSSALPEVAPAQIPARWFRHALFDHDAHQMLTCTACHTRALTSVVSTDVLIPGIDTCRKCHRSGAEAAESNCSECHSYHDWTKEKKVDGKFAFSDFR